ncbi:MAG: CBM96 family carbohydrate-binding protein, partial [Planctomycetota bacterium]
TGGTATGGGTDYTLAAGTLTFDNNSTQEDINIVIVNDGDPESNETIVITLSNPNGPSIQLGNPSENTFTIIDGSPLVEFDIAGGSGLETTTPVNVLVSLSEAASETVTVDYNVTGGTAEGGGVDYNMISSGTLTFNVNDVNKTILIDIISDGNDSETAETIIIELSNPNEASLGSDTEYTYTILSELIDLQVDFALVDCNYDVRSETAKSGWYTWAANRWYDMYSHDGVWEDGSSSKPNDTGIDGSGVHAVVTLIREGDLGLKAYDLSGPLGGSQCPCGSVGLTDQPITNTWLQAVDWPEFEWGSIQLAFHDLPAGEYELYSYHNQFGCDRAGSNCGGGWTPVTCDCYCDKDPNMPMVRAMSCKEARELSYQQQGAWQVLFPGISWSDGPYPEGVESINEVNDFAIQQVSDDANLVPSLIKFSTDGSPVMVLYKAGCCHADPVRTERIGRRGILNAFELVQMTDDTNDANDTTAPTPNPATFSSAPNAISSTEITMTATTGSDPCGPVEYFFNETTDNNGATDSGWVTNPVYNDDGLDPNTQYTYTVQMRDAVKPTPNTGTVSSPANATTYALDTSPPTPNPATFASAPNAISSTEITMTATTGSDPCGPVEYFFNETTDNNGATDSGWVTNPVYNDDGLDPNTEYTYTVQMRDATKPTPNTGTVSSPASATTDVAANVDDFNATEDAYVYEAKPNNNYGSETDLRVRATGSSKQTDSYLKFVVSGVGTVTDATLKVYSDNVNMTVYAYQSATTTWAEGTIDWSSAPGTTGGALDTQAAGESEWVEFDVSSLVTGNATYSFVLLGASTSANRDFFSSESAYMPVLSVTHE